MKTFGDRVRERREQLEMSQEGLGKAAGLSQSTVAQIERGRNKGTKNILGLARALEVRADWLERGRGDMLESATHKTSPADASIRDPNDGMFKDLPTTHSHRIGEQSVQTDANVLPRDVPILSYEKASQMSAAVDPWSLGEPLGRETIHKPFSTATFAVPIVDASKIRGGPRLPDH
jgi:transcriptional regulator with XRE-family HTH domain